MVFAVGIRTTHIEENVGDESVEGCADGREKCVEILGVADVVGHVEVDVGGRFVGGIVVELVDGESEDGRIVGEDGGGAVAMVDVGVDDDGFADGGVGLEAADGDGDIVNGAEAFAVAGVGVMKTATDVAGKAIAKCGACGGDGATGGEPEGVNELLGIGDFEFHEFAGGERGGFEFVDPVRSVDEEDVGVGGGIGAEDVFGGCNGVAEKFVGDEAEFLRGEDVGAEVEVVAFVVEEFEGEHF